MTTLTVTKHHGLGNDFLVLVSRNGGPTDATAALARRLCDRRRGIGADGLLVVAEALGCPPTMTGPPPDVTMTLFNADGTRAEMSGNGIRCLVQAWARRIGMRDGTVHVLTDAGLRTVSVAATDDPATILASVDMGAVTIIGAPANWDALGCDPMRPVAHLSLGNPHSVVAVDDVHSIDLADLGAEVPEVNLEVVAPGPKPDSITMRVHERGAGITEACGTGACAAAYAASQWGLVGPDVREITVHMDGGDAIVSIDDPRAGEVTLVGPATYIATITITIDI
jgi:diaminopimelate epimerase